MGIVTYSRLEKANLAVTNELWKLGFYDEYMQRVDVYLVAAGAAYGWQYYGGNGNICIPAVSFSRLAGLFTGRYVSLRDVLRHEFGHALADTHRGLIRSAQFKEVFGAAHSADVSWEYDPKYHVTEYAAEGGPAEDFAEVFMLYVKHKGAMPSHISSPPIKRRWRFIHKLRTAVSNGHRRW